jgi:hypothetical protein
MLTMKWTFANPLQLVLVLGDELPLVPLGPLRKCPHPVVLHTFVLSPTLFSIKVGVTSSALCFLYSLLNPPTVFAFFMVLGTWFQLSMTLLEKKLRLTSSLVVFGRKFNGSSALRVARPVWAANWNQVQLSTLSIPLTI